MPRQNERIANSALGILLKRMLTDYTVIVESSQTLAEGAGKQPDILVTAHGRAPVVIEAEFMPAYTAERDARSRLGRRAVDGRRIIEAAIAVRYPIGFESATDVFDEMPNARLEYAVLYESGSRFPASGWLAGTSADLAELARMVSVPQRVVNAVSELLEEGIERGAAVLEELADTRPGVSSKIVARLGMPDVPQTRRMACAVIANAMVFHDRVAGMHQGIDTIDMVCGDGSPNPKAALLRAWQHILSINYWPIFAIARDIVTQLPTQEATELLVRLRNTAGEVSASGANFAHDLTGEIFQRLIADRKYLATFYTLPASAALLARLTVGKLNGVDWSESAAVGGLRVGDFACGTGALLSAVYEQLATRHEQAGGNRAALHPLMMEEVLFGCDVMPSAIHITGATLSGMQPKVGFGKTRLYNLTYGRQGDGTVRIGSLDLLRSSATMTLFNTSEPAMRTGSAGEEAAAQVIAEVPDESFEIVIMNPPFTSNTKHYDAADGVLNAAFAAFDTSKADQDKMAARLKKQAAGTCYHGHAGLASVFVALADCKIKPGGVVGFVLPFTAVNGVSWTKFRELISTRYTDVTVVSIAANGMDMSFSSDTGMAECLLIARRLLPEEKPSHRANFVSISSRPQGFPHAQELAKALAAESAIRRIEAGPFGGTAIYCGDEVVGEALNAPIDAQERGWGAARILDASVAQAAHALTLGKLWLPAEPEALEIPVVPLKEVGSRGLHHGVIAVASSGGPFAKAPASPTATYPALWNHNAKNETRIVCQPDSQLRVRQGMEAKAASVWATASRVHLTLDFRFNSQPLGAAITEQKCLGGRAWPNISFCDSRHDKAWILWANSTLGLLRYWWHSSLQQPGRGILTISSAASLPILDLRALSNEQLTTAATIFEGFRNRKLLPAFKADTDPNRDLLDGHVICDLLGFGTHVYKAVRRVAAKWCAEPSVHGGKLRD